MMKSLHPTIFVKEKEELSGIHLIMIPGSVLLAQLKNLDLKLQCPRKFKQIKIKHS